MSLVPVSAFHGCLFMFLNPGFYKTQDYVWYFTFTRLSTDSSKVNPDYNGRRKDEGEEEKMMDTKF